MTIFFFNLKVAYRSLIKSPGQSIISIITLAVGMLFFILSVYWLRYENSYDDFHRDHERLTKVVRMNDRAETGFDEHHFGLLKDELLKNHSFIESATNYYLLHWLITKDQHRHNDIVFLIDNSFPDIFDIENVKGDYRQIFHNPRFVAITEKSAHGIFRNENPIGQTIDINGEVCEVCAIIKDWSNHTSIKFGIIGNLDLETEKLNNWNNMAVHLIVKLSESNDMKSNYYKEVYEENSKRNYSFYPLKDFHRYTIGYKGVSVKYLYVKLFSVLGLILIISAVVNYLMLLDRKSVV